MLNEEKLILKVQKRGDREAANQLIEKYYDEIYRFSYKQLFAKQEAMDLTQEIFIAVLKGIKSYDSRYASFRTWLYKIATNKAIDYMRKEQRNPEFEDYLEGYYGGEDNIGEKMVIKAQMVAVLKSVADKDERTKAIFQWKYFDEKSFSEIGALLGISENTAKTLYYRLLKSLRKECG